MSNKKNMCDGCTTLDPHCDSVTCTVSVIYKKLKIYDEMVSTISHVLNVPTIDGWLLNVILRPLLERAKKLQEERE